MERNVILSTVLYKPFTSKVCPVILREYKKKNVDKDFVAVIVFTVQKPTYKKIEDFLRLELNND